MSRKKDYPGQLCHLCETFGFEMPVREYRFCARRWRFDLAWPDRKLALEVEGGVWIRGRHNRPMGFIRDIEKYNTAQNMGWKVLRVTGQDVKTWKALHLIAEALGTEVMLA